MRDATSNLTSESAACGVANCVVGASDGGGCTVASCAKMTSVAARRLLCSMPARRSFTGGSSVTSVAATASVAVTSSVAATASVAAGCWQHSSATCGGGRGLLAALSAGDEHCASADTVSCQDHTVSQTDLLSNGWACWALALQSCFKSSDDMVESKFESSK